MSDRETIFCLQYQCNIKQKSDEKKRKIPIRGLQVDPIPNTILQNTTIIIVWQTARRINIKLLALEGLRVVYG